MKQVKCIVFDIDDTLYLERDYVSSGFEAVGRWMAVHRSVSGFGTVCTSLFAEGRRGDIFDRALERAGLEASRENVDALVAVYRAHSPAIELLPDSTRCLNRLTSRGCYRLGAITGGPVTSQRAKVDALGLSRWLDPIIFAGQWGKEFDKPHPRAFEEFERQAGVHGEECLYVSDNPAKDFVAPRALGWHVVRLRRSGGIHFDAPSDCLGMLELSSLDPLAELFDSERAEA